MTRPDVSRFLEPELSASDRPVGSDPNACYSQDVTPALIETVTEQVVEQPPELSKDGTLRRPATYRTVTEARIVKDRSDIWFQTPCPDELTPQFIASLQRALAARGLFAGRVSGVMDAETRQAVRRYQKAEGLHSGVISTAAAKRLGLAVYERDEALRKRR
ncbi:peptidoglycan-binding domain-containing protein [Oceaniglobus trochenteri]|uniref:peptidoglycan-binding domain-containing protein n=1 Tax=Oceaniglobus trochenteri TaxID=2763260 RepID=UPI001CFF7713|nr:peptidoglycan-binding domain-containing protein [Oceaniglobus trochenteri]